MIGSYTLSQTNPISGYTIARNVMKFKYPFVQWAEAMAALDLDEVVIGYDPTTDDGTHELMLETQDRFGFRLFESVWDMDNFDRGLELGVQTDKVMAECKYNWKLYVQLDEAFHEDDAELIKELPDLALDEGSFGVDFQRIYFFQNLHTIRKDWCAQITRLTLTDTHTYSQGDGMSCVPVSAGFSKHMLSPIWMYHYSRIGDADVISKRVRNMDTFYHADKDLIPESELPDYDFTPRQWDNYAKSGLPPVVDGEFLKYLGTHPLPFAELYQEFE